MADFYSAADFSDGSRRTPPPKNAPAGSSNGSQRGVAAGGSTTATGSGSPSSGNVLRKPTIPGMEYGPRSENTVGVLFPRPYSDVYVDTTSLRGIMGASNYNSATWVGQYTAGSSGKPGTLPEYGSEQVQDYDWLFGIIAKDYYSTSNAKKWYEEQFLEQALNVSRSEGRMVNVVDLAYDYAINKGLLTKNGQLTEAGKKAYAIYMGDKPKSSSSSGGSSYSGYSGGGGGYSSGGGGGGQVRLTDPTSARGLLLQTMQGVLGRNPSEREYKQFLATLNESEMANPQTVSVEGDNAVYSGGTDPSVLAMEFAQDAEDYKERQGDMYFQTYMRSLAGGV